MSTGEALAIAIVVILHAFIFTFVPSLIVKP
jgi:FlaG/FlaF family flagellin (archaellin)